MTALPRTPIAPVVLRRLPAAAGSRARSRNDARGQRPLPVAVLASRSNPSAVYRVAAVGHRGQIAERAVMRAMGWTPSLSLEIAAAGAVLVVRADPAGPFRTSGRGEIALPARVRRWCGLRQGDRVLLAADPPRQELLVFPPAALDTITAHHRSRPVDKPRPSEGTQPPQGGEPA